MYCAPRNALIMWGKVGRRFVNLLSRKSNPTRRQAQPWEVDIDDAKLSDAYDSFCEAVEASTNPFSQGPLHWGRCALVTILP